MVQLWSWWALIQLHASATSNLSAFSFIMLTGLHAAHGAGGIILLAVVWTCARRRRYGIGKHEGITYAAMYVHFHDGVRLVLYSVIVVAA